MPLNVKYTDEDDFLLATVTGDCRTLKELADFGSSIIATSGSRGRPCVLMDFRGMTMELESYHITTYSEQLMDIGLPALGLRLAGLADTEHIAITRAFETALRNRSINLRAFLDKDEALKWLLRKT